MKRREFVRHSALAAAGLGVAGNSNFAHGILTPTTIGRGIAQDRDALGAAALNSKRYP